MFLKGHSCIAGQEIGVSPFFATSKDKISGVSSLGASLCLVFLANRGMNKEDLVHIYTGNTT